MGELAGEMESSLSNLLAVADNDDGFRTDDDDDDADDNDPLEHAGSKDSSRRGRTQGRGDVGQGLDVTLTNQHRSDSTSDAAQKQGLHPGSGTAGFNPKNLTRALNSRKAPSTIIYVPLLQPTDPSHPAHHYVQYVRQYLA